MNHCHLFVLPRLGDVYSHESTCAFEKAVIS